VGFIKGCDSNFGVNIFKLQMERLSCIKQYVIEKRLKSIITMTNNLIHNLPKN